MTLQESIKTVTHKELYLDLKHDGQFRITNIIGMLNLSRKETGSRSFRTLFNLHDSDAYSIATAIQEVIKSGEKK